MASPQINRRMWISSMRISDGPIWTAMAGLVAMKPSLSSRALVTQTGPCAVEVIDRMTTHHATLSLMERFREGRPLPAVLPSNVMFDLSNIFQPQIITPMLAM
ncbi:hypothetical protein DVH24_010205 [Malus domestica]|uniref:Uncharacterized protein n=1 Tax=Malus domestica TaxID=3750 RepID=A0A498JR16_MALDO|nr:hypothetical protein DVH24_010205 [Malus domestica]